MKERYLDIEDTFKQKYKLTNAAISGIYQDCGFSGCKIILTNGILVSTWTDFETIKGFLEGK